MKSKALSIKNIIPVLMVVILFGLCPAAQAGSTPALIAYIDEHAYALYTVEPGKPLTTKLIYGTGYPRSPKWSPNGQTLAFSASDGPPGTTYSHILFANRSGELTGSLLTGSHSRITGLDWSPDGKKIAYMCGDGGSPEDWEVCVVDVANGDHHAVTTPSTNPLSNSGYVNRGTISWSSNGSDIAFDGDIVAPCSPDLPPSFLCPVSNIYSVNVDTGVTTQITTMNASHPQYSPDGHHLVFMHRTSAGVPPGIVVSDAFGGGATLVVPLEHVARGFGPNPAWSPDGKQIVFDTGTDGANNGNTDLFVVDVTGPFSMTRVTDTPNDSAQPDWTASRTTCTVPKLKGTTFKNAKALIKKAGCTLGKITGPAKNRSSRSVKSQSIAAKTNIDTGTPIDIKLK